MSNKAPKLPEIYFDNRGGSYWLKLQCNRFLNLDSRNVKLHLQRGGFEVDRELDTGMKAGDNALVVTQIDRFVDYAGPLSGHKTGLFTAAGGRRVLVTSETEPVKPAKKAHAPFLEQFIGELFGDQSHFALYWLKLAWTSLVKSDFRPGQLCVLAGPSNCGKSFFQVMVTELLGGRSGKPYRYMIGETSFNSDLAAAEHLVIEDENASSDIRSRRTFGAAIKDFTVNTQMSVHAKGREAITLPTFKRVTLSVNDEPENLMILPPLDNSILDKVMLFKCTPAKLSEEREENLSLMRRDLPGLAAMLKELRIPPRWKCPRFGVRAYHNPELLELLADISPESRLLSLIDEVLFKRRTGESHEDFRERTAEGWRGTAVELEKELRSSAFTFAVEKLLYFSSACGVYLSRLAQKFPDRFEQRRNNGRTGWQINK